MIDGIINVYKPAGFTSFDVVAKLRGILKQKKIGHTGTLDPMAEGVLLICLGKATKLVDLLTEGDKAYHAVMKLGIETDTEDITGQIIKQAHEGFENELSVDSVEAAICSFVGAYEQIPPMYSAIKKDGRKLYEYARAGMEIERAARPVVIYDIQNIVCQQGDYAFDVNCSKGTYIRSLVRDIGRKLSCYATLSSLTRLCVHGFYVEDSIRLEEIEERMQDGTLSDIVFPIDSLLKEYPAFDIKEEGKKYLYNGNKLSPRYFSEMASIVNGRIRVCENGKFLALYDYDEKECIYKPFKMFLT